MPPYIHGAGHIYHILLTRVYTYNKIIVFLKVMQSNYQMLLMQIIYNNNELVEEKML